MKYVNYTYELAITQENNVINNLEGKNISIDNRAYITINSNSSAYADCKYKSF
jgi:hypothetical protein